MLTVAGVLDGLVEIGDDLVLNLKDVILTIQVELVAEHVRSNEALNMYKIIKGLTTPYLIHLLQPTTRL